MNITELKKQYDDYHYLTVPDESLAAVQQNGDALQYVKDQTEALCLAAVQQYGYALQFVKDQTEALCLAAVQQNGNALQYVNEIIFK